MPPIFASSTGRAIAQLPVPAPTGRTFYVLVLQGDTRVAPHVIKFVENRHSRVKILSNDTELPRDLETTDLRLPAIPVAWNESDNDLADIVATCNDWYENHASVAMPRLDDLPPHDGPVLFLYVTNLNINGPLGYRFAMVPYTQVTLAGAQYARFLADTITNVMTLLQSSDWYKGIALEGHNDRTAADVAEIVRLSPLRVRTGDFIYE